MAVASTSRLNALFLSGALLFAGALSTADAAFPTNITSDNTLPTPTLVPPPSGNVYNINGGTPRGSNLFHSFQSFNVGTGDIASFNGAPIIKNILSRVTGGESMIDGQLRSTISGANLYLMNPAGVTFGPNATLDVSGSFHVTTADYLRLTDGVRFTAVPGAQDAVLSMAPVAAFGFLPNPARPNPAPITIQGSVLQVPSTDSLPIHWPQTLSLVGGNITIQSGTLEDGTVQSSTLIAPGGRIQLASVASTGEVVIRNTDGTPALDIDPSASRGRIEILGSSSLDVSPLPSLDQFGNPVFDALGNQLFGVPLLDEFGNPTFDEDGNQLFNSAGGSVLIRAGSITVDGSSIVSSTMGNGPGANPGIDLNATGDVIITNFAFFSVSEAASKAGLGRAGDIHIAAATIEVSGASSMFSFSSGAGVGGDIVLHTDSPAGSVKLSGGSVITSETFTDGSGGKLEISAPTVALEEDASLATNTNSVGKGGNIVVNAGTFSISSGASILSHADSTGPSAGPGTVTIQGLAGEGTNADLVTISGSFPGSDPPKEPSRISSDSVGAAPAGDIKINTKTLTLADGGELQSGRFDRSNAGNVTVTATTINMSNGSKISTAAFDERAGQLHLSAPSINVDGSSIQASAASTGQAGDIVVETGSLSLVNGARVDSSTKGEGPGGTVTIRGLEGAGTSADLVAISGPGSGLFTDTKLSGAAGTAAHGGVIKVNAAQVQLTNGSSIQASTVGSGQGGGIVVEAGSLSLVNGARLDSSTSGAGAGGTVTIQGLGGAGTRADLVAISGPGSGVFTNTEVAGAGGSINVRAGVVTVSDDGTISGASNGSVVTATGGLIDIQAGQVQLTNGGTITAKSFGPANAGSVSITVDDSFVSQSGSITTEALKADGGDIHLNAGRLIHLTNSEVTSTVGSVDVTTTVGGNIFIDPQFVILDNSRILANAFAGTGGNINIVTGVLLVDPLSIIDASSALGVSGTVTIQSPISNLSETLAPLPQAFLRTGALLSSRCVARLGGPASSFVVAGRDAIPMEPGGLLPSPLYSFEAASASANSDETPPTPNVHLGADGLVALNLVGLDGAADCAP